jgi:methylenetetrahydrofolate dehydrogenase (NADP+) / methenyltetrahydrofolate cyclohydrolase
MKILNGAELADFIKERQARQVRGLRQAHGIAPKLAIVQTVDNPVIDKYVALKKTYGDDVLIDVEHHKVTQAEAQEVVARLNDDAEIHGIIIQLPLADPDATESLINAVDPKKDVDGLGAGAYLEPATPMAINWLLAGYNVELRGKKILIVGQGRLVGRPLAKIWQDSGLDVTTLDKETEDISPYVKQADVIVTATGVPRLITSDMLRPDVVVVDAATASESGKLVGDVAEDVRERHDLTITPVVGGVGPLTVTALFENVIRAAQEVAQNS